MTSAKELKQIIGDQVLALKRAHVQGFTVKREEERLRNLMINYMDDILAAIDQAATADEKIMRLTVEIESADAELQEKDAEIAELKAAPKPARGKKEAVVKQ